MEAVILRPPLVYGPGVKANFLRLLKVVDARLPLPLGSVHSARSMVFVGNLASAIEIAATHPRAGGEIFNVADDAALSTKELLAQLGQLLERPARFVPVPVVALQLGGRLCRRETEIARLIGSRTVATDKIKTSLGWSAPYKVHDGLKETVAWFKAQRARTA